MATRAPVFKPWTPFRADLTPPSGFYDPTLDANLGSVTRGLQDTTADTQKQQGRLTSDNALGHAQIDQGLARGLQDIGTARAGLQTSFDRGNADIGQQRAYGQTDHAQQLADLSLAYSRKANSQRQRMGAMGVLRGGAALQAAEKRAANQAHDQQPLDTNFQRLMSGLDTQQSRLGQDFSSGGAALDTQTSRLGENQQQASGMLDLNTLRSTQDLTTGLTRAQREANAFGLDTRAAKAAQAAGAGWNPYAGRAPGESGTGAGAHRTVVRNGISYVIDPSGKVISKRKAG